jgi:nucleotide-binding universal stress UspA family protein
VPDGAEEVTQVHRVLLPLDAPLATQEALYDTVLLALAADVELLALHIWAPRDVPMFNDQPHHEWRAWSQDFMRRCWPGSMVRPELQRRVGAPAEEIVAAVADTRADLLVLAWSQDLSPGRARVVRAALRTSSKPVLLLPAEPPGMVDDRTLVGQPHREIALATVAASTG